MLSFVIPAYNEAAQIQEVLAAVSSAAAGHDHEIIVVNDASEDATAQLAADAGATVIEVNKRQISAVRNAGAAVAVGDPIFFVDGDTFPDAKAVELALAALQDGADGGGAFFRFDDAPLVPRMANSIGGRVARWLGICGGCFLFVTREAFDAVGGFDEELFAAEECVFTRALRRRGRLVILRHAVTTSGRKLRQFSALGLIVIATKIAWQGVRQREGLEVWYDGERE